MKCCIGDAQLFSTMQFAGESADNQTRTYLSVGGLVLVSRCFGCLLLEEAVFTQAQAVERGVGSRPKRNPRKDIVGS